MQFRVESLRMSFESLFRQANNCGNDKTCEIFADRRWYGTLRHLRYNVDEKIDTARKRGDLLCWRRRFRRPSHFMLRGRESISDSSVARGTHHACITHRPWVAPRTLYVAQGCSSSGSLLCRVVVSPADTHIHQIALWSLHVICNNLIVLVREISVDSAYDFDSRYY